MTIVKQNLPENGLIGKLNLLFLHCMCKVCLVDKATKPFESNSTPARKAERCTG
nr:MAG TPA: hypothetical protein [Caudoviricetes sp.]